MTSIAIYHYVYRITNIRLGKHYYGARSSKVEPKLDLGIKYFSSAVSKTGKAFKKDQKDNPQDYRYKVVGAFSTREDAIAREIRLHILFDVKMHPNFYNESNQTSTGFDRSGIPGPVGPWSDERKAEWSKAQLDRCQAKREAGISMAQTEEHTRRRVASRLHTNQQKREAGISLKLGKQKNPYVRKPRGPYGPRKPRTDQQATIHLKTQK